MHVPLEWGKATVPPGGKNWRAEVWKSVKGKGFMLESAEHNTTVERGFQKTFQQLVHSFVSQDLLAHLCDLLMLRPTYQGTVKMTNA